MSGIRQTPAARWGDALSSAWAIPTFDAKAVREIAAAAAPRWELATDADAIAAEMNDAAAFLFSAMCGEAKPSEAESWASAIASACAGLRAACGHPPARAASRLGIPANDWPRFAEMLETAQRVRTIANAYSVRAAAAKAETTAARPAAENRWLDRMAEIFSCAFGRPAGVTKDGKHERGGPCPRFISEAAQLLLADSRISAAPEPWGNALRRFSSPKSVAGRLEARRVSQEASR